MRALGPAPSQRQATQNILRAADVVAERLGNTRAVCRKYYIHPALQEAYLRGLTARLPDGAGSRRVRRRRAPPALRRDEIAVLQLLARQERRKARLPS